MGTFEVLVADVVSCNAMILPRKAAVAYRHVLATAKEHISVSVNPTVSGEHVRVSDKVGQWKGYELGRKKNLKPRGMSFPF
jgi:hypothetical protein